MIVRSVFPGRPAKPLERAEETYVLPRDRERLDALYHPPTSRWLRVNLISSIDGSAAGKDGTSGSLTRGADRTVLGAIRRASDVVLVGATTIRTEGYLLPKTARLAIVTGSGDLSGHSIPADTPTGRVLVLCPASAVEQVERTLGAGIADVIVLPSKQHELAPIVILDELRARGFDSIVCEGGPSLAGALVAEDLVDELCLSVAPVLTGRAVIGAPAPLLGHQSQSGTVPFTPRVLTQLLIDEAGVTYSRWSLTGRRATPNRS